MEECLICFEEKKEEQFIFFPCQHKICSDCYPIFIVYSSNCPLCNTPIIKPHSEIEINEPVQIQSISPIEFCKLWCGIIMMGGAIYYLLQLK